MLDYVEGARARAEAGELAFGTVDAFLIFRLTEGAVHATDATNASRTLLYDIHRGAWDDELCRRLGVPLTMLPEVRDSAGDFGVTELLGAPIPIRGIAGDQQAATVGQACFSPGMMKSTYGTGCFALLNTGATPVVSHNRLLTTVAYQLAGPAHLCARRRDLRRRRGGAMAARRARPDRRRRRDRGLGGRRRSPRRTSIWCPPSSASARLIGTRRRAGRCSASPAARRARNSPAPRWRASATRRAT